MTPVTPVSAVVKLAREFPAAVKPEEEEQPGAQKKETPENPAKRGTVYSADGAVHNDAPAPTFAAQG